MNNLEQAYQLLDRGELPAAEAAFRALLQSEPANPHVIWGMGRIATSAGEDRAAAHYYAQCVQALPGQPDPLIALGDALINCREFERAGISFQEAVKQQAAYAPAHYALGQFLLGNGNSAQATQEFERTLQLQPDHAPAHWSHSRLHRFMPGDDALQGLEQQLQTAHSEKEQMLLHYALGKACDDVNDHAAAFLHWQAANDTQLASTNYRVAEMANHFKAIKSIFDQQLLARCSATDDTTPQMIFIVGQPRSGSTLLERMLSRHPEIASAGECKTIGNQIAKAIYGMTGKHFPQACADLHSEQLTKLSELYISYLPESVKGSRCVIDKLPANYQSLGLIQMMFPKARIIHLQRDAMDSCFSIFRNYFSQNEPFFCTQREIGLYHQLYRQTMTHWQAVLPKRIHATTYESLTAQTEQQLRAILDYCQLPWHPEVLHPEAATDFISTLSDTQARSPVTAGNSGHWRKYEDYLGDLLSAIDYPRPASET